ncbi:hypothetical protein BN2476_170099 [Paraburkholderia piptadeniae]|uniref:Uncharacterized protein n=1 Tax=Paraburkholderia piptadeniae TaxID=1701573 RepID=A0A1N7RTD9_9BURK|nr:hypothetical protein BN2476_170099 [Paraburkholderia piptadeniae]
MERWFRECGWRASAACLAAWSVACRQRRKEKTRGTKGDTGFFDSFIGGRSDRIRTYDPLIPNQMRYQAALRSDASQRFYPFWCSPVNLDRNEPTKQSGLGDRDGDGPLRIDRSRLTVISVPSTAARSRRSAPRRRAPSDGSPTRCYRASLGGRRSGAGSRRSTEWFRGSRYLSLYGRATNGDRSTRAKAA